MSKKIKYILIFFFASLVGALNFWQISFKNSNDVKRTVSNDSNFNRQCKQIYDYCYQDSECCMGSCIENQCSRPANAMNCGLPGEPSSSQDQCCSQNSYNNICLGSVSFPAVNGSICINSWECKSKNCYQGNCFPSQEMRAYVGQKCINNSDCLSQNCFNNVCMGSSSELAPFGAYCLNSYECGTGNCIQKKCQ